MNFIRPIIEFDNIIYNNNAITKLKLLEIMGMFGLFKLLQVNRNYSSLHETSHQITILYLFQLLNKICLY